MLAGSAVSVGAGRTKEYHPTTTWMEVGGLGFLDVSHGMIRCGMPEDREATDTGGGVQVRVTSLRKSEERNACHFFNNYSPLSSDFSSDFSSDCPAGSCLHECWQPDGELALTGRFLESTLAHQTPCLSSRASTRKLRATNRRLMRKQPVVACKRAGGGKRTGLRGCSSCYKAFLCWQGYSYQPIIGAPRAHRPGHQRYPVEVRITSHSTS